MHDDETQEGATTTMQVEHDTENGKLLDETSDKDLPLSNCPPPDSANDNVAGTKRTARAEEEDNQGDTTRPHPQETQTDFSAPAAGENHDCNTGTPPQKRARPSNAPDVEDQEEDHLLHLQNIWKTNNGTAEDKAEAIRETWNLISKVVKELVQDGITAHQELERANQKLKAAMDDCSIKTREIERLHASEKKSRESIANLLRAVGASNEEAKDNAQAKLVEARMRADLLRMTSLRDKEESDLAEIKRKCEWLETDLADAKAKLAKAQQEKMQIERDQRAALAMAKTLQENKHSEVDYYKRKATEMETQVQGLTAVLAEKNRQIEDIRRQHDRSMSENRLAAYRINGNGGIGDKKHS